MQKFARPVGKTKINWVLSCLSYKVELFKEAMQKVPCANTDTSGYDASGKNMWKKSSVFLFPEDKIIMKQC